MRRRRPAQALRTAIDCLPLESRKAMLAGIEANRIIVGAYTDRDGGVCPMLAAHRGGGRTALASFARSWDRYTGVKAGRRRTASDRELATLRAMLETSIATEEHAGLGDLGEAIAEHQALRAKRDLSRELRALEEALDYSPSPGRMNCISGTMQKGEVLSR